MANNYTVDDWRFTSIGSTNLASKPMGVTPLRHNTGHHFAAQATAQLRFSNRQSWLGNGGFKAVKKASWHNKCLKFGYERRRMRNFSFRDEVASRPSQSNRTQPRPRRSAPSGTSFWSKFFAKVRAIFIFLLLAAIATFVLAHLNEINALAAAKARTAETVIRKDTAQDPLRQGALNYEKAVESVGTGQKP
jgi:hypothetical protein